MHRLRWFVFLAAVSILPFAPVTVSAVQNPPAPPLIFPSDPSTESTNPPTNAAGGSLKVSLQLDDKSPIIEAAEVRLIPNEGYEVVGSQTGTKGEMLFSGLTPGKYILEARAPGYLAVRLSLEIDAAHLRGTLNVVMKPKPVADKTAATVEEKHTAEALPAKAPVATPKLAPRAERDFWQDHELEQNVPQVQPGAACSMPQLLRGVGERMIEFVGNLEKFTATEQVEHYAFNSGKESRTPEKRRFAYVASVSRSQEGTFFLEEYRDGSVDPFQFPAKVATNGLIALDLIFHPKLSGDFDFVCEGLGQ